MLNKVQQQIEELSGSGITVDTYELIEMPEDARSRGGHIAYPKGSIVIRGKSTMNGKTKVWMQLADYPIVDNVVAAHNN